MREPCIDCGTIDGKWRLKDRCQKCYNRWYYQQNRQAAIDRANKYRTENREQYNKARVLISRRKRAARSNAEKKSINRHEWQRRVAYMTDAEREVRRQRSKEWYQAHKGAPERTIIARNYKHRRRAITKKAKGTITPKQWQAILDRYNHLCAYCSSSSEIQMDHIVPLVLGGTHSAENIVPACRPCNRSNSKQLLTDWYYSGH